MSNAMEEELALSARVLTEPAMRPAERRDSERHDLLR
jgi:hypothetical protein